MEWPVISKNNLFFWFLVTGYVFGVFLYDALPLSFVDELMAAFLVLFLGVTYWERRKYFLLNHLLILCGFFIFQIGYSLLIHSNVPAAILMDATIQIKPFLGFYCTFILAPSLNQTQKRGLTLLSISGAIFLLLVALTDKQFEVFSHPSRFATAASITAILFLYCSSFSWEDIAAFCLLLFIGIFSTRSKFYGFFVLSVSLCIAVKCGYRFRLNYLSTIASIAILAGAIWVAWPKIQLYFFQGVLHSQEMWARPALYVTAYTIFFDYFPFGSGLGSFATFASSAYYSPLYVQYGLDKLWGLSPSYPAFIADTYYPVLAETGICGVLFFLLFWISIVLRAKSMYKNAPTAHKEFLIFILIILFFIIESVADSTFTHNRGLFMMILMGLALSGLNKEQEDSLQSTNDPYPNENSDHAKV